MASAPVLPQVSVEEYEQTPELFERHEYVDGRLIQRPGATWKHAELHASMGALLWEYYPRLYVGASLHCKLRESSWRIVDIAVQKPEIARTEKYALTPLLLAIEIRSPEDKWSEMLRKFEHYHAWGVPYCWLLDPETERAWTYHKGSDFDEVTDKDYIQAGEIRLSIEEIFPNFKQHPKSCLLQRGGTALS